LSDAFNKDSDGNMQITGKTIIPCQFIFKGTELYNFVAPENVARRWRKRNGFIMNKELKDLDQIVNDEHFL